MITNKITGKRNVGQTVQPLDIRWKQHQDKRSGCRLLIRSIQKHGPENFEIKVLSRCDSIEEMNHRESYYIRLFNTLAPNGYNLKTGGNNSRPSAETKALISAGNKGIKKPKSAEHCKKISLATIGTKQSPEEKQKRAITLYQPIEVPELEMFFSSRKEASKILGTHNHIIRSVLNGSLPEWKGLTFRKAQKEEVKECSPKSLELLAIFIANNKGCPVPRKKVSAEIIENKRLSQQIPIFVPELNISFDSIKITSEKLGISPHSIEVAIKENRASANGLSFFKLKKGTSKGMKFGEKGTDTICDKIKQNRRRAQVEILCVETGKKYSSCTEAAKDLDSHGAYFTKYFAGKMSNIKGLTFRKTVL